MSPAKIHQRNVTVFCCCCGLSNRGRECCPCRRVRPVCGSGGIPVPPRVAAGVFLCPCAWQRGYSCASSTAGQCWFPRRLGLLLEQPGPAPLVEFSFTLWFISVSLMGLSAFMLSMFLLTLAKPGPVLRRTVKGTIINDNVLCETFASCKFSLFSKKK